MSLQEQVVYGVAIFVFLSFVLWVSYKISQMPIPEDQPKKMDYHINDIIYTSEVMDLLNIIEDRLSRIIDDALIEKIKKQNKTVIEKKDFIDLINELKVENPIFEKIEI
jgi:hypothetical protein